MSDFVFDPASGDIYLSRETGESECAYRIRQAGFKVRTACRAQQIAIIPALRFRERAFCSIRLAEPRSLILMSCIGHGRSRGCGGSGKLLTGPVEPPPIPPWIDNLHSVSCYAVNRSE